MILKAHTAPGMVEHRDAVVLERVNHGARAIDVIVIAEDCETDEPLTTLL